MLEARRLSIFAGSSKISRKYFFNLLILVGGYKEGFLEA